MSNPILICFLAAAGSLTGGDPAGGEEIIVSAERRDQGRSSISASVSVVSREQLLTVMPDHPSEILNRVPGVLIHRGSGQEHLTSIRSPILTGGAGAGSFLFLENNVPLRAAGFANVNGLFEAHTEIAERIEIVRGPSGPLYGANAIHGVINVLGPDPGKDHQLIDGSVDTIGRLKLNGVLSHADNQSSFVLGISVLDDPGFRADSGVDQQKLTLRHSFEEDHISIKTSLSASNLNQETAGFVQGSEAYLDSVLRRSNPNPEAFRDARSVRLSSDVGIKTRDNLTFRITPYARWTQMSFLQHFLPSRALEQNSHYSFGFQSGIYLEPGERLALIAGLDVDRTNGDLSEVQTRPTIFSFTQGTHYDYEIGALSVSPFLSASGRLTPRLTVTAAARMDYTRYDYDNLAQDGIVGRFLRVPDRVNEFTTFSPKFDLRYAVNKGHLFARYARGARPPQTTDLYRLQINQTNNNVDPETIDAVEVGGYFAGERWALNFAAYAMEKENFFFRDADGFNVDDGRTRHIGAELDGSVQFTPEIGANFNLSYGRHTYRFDRPVQSFIQSAEAITNGNDIDTAPRWLAGIRAYWSPEFAPLRSEIEWVFVDDYFIDASNSRTYPGHNIFHLRTRYHLRNKMAIYLNIRNLFNTFYAERADFAFRSERYFPGEGRVATLGIRFGE